MSVIQNPAQQGDESNVLQTYISRQGLLHRTAESWARTSQSDRLRLLRHLYQAAHKVPRDERFRELREGVNAVDDLEKFLGYADLDDFEGYIPLILKMYLSLCWDHEKKRLDVGAFDLNCAKARELHCPLPARAANMR